MDESITPIPLCAACSVIFSRIPLDENPDSNTQHEFSYKADLVSLQRDGTCAWCIELTAAVNDYEYPESLSHVPLIVCLKFIKYWGNDTVSRHTLILEIRVEKLAYSRRSYELFFCASIET